MKTKGLAIILVIAILASCLVISTSAAVDSATHSVTLTNCNYTIVGWNGMGAPTDTLNVEGSDGSYMIKKLAAGDYVNAGKVVMSYAHGNVVGDGVDLTGCDYLVLHAYVSSLAIADLKWQVELNSNARTSDQKGEQERTYTFAGLAGDLKAGWNELKIPLNVLSADQIKKVQWLRLFTSQNAGSLTDDVIVAIDAVYGLKSDSTKVTVSDCKLEKPGWGGKAVPTATADRAYMSQTVSGKVPGPASGGPLMNLYFNRVNAYTNEADQYVDATGMKFLVFDLYVSDASKIKDTQFNLEIGSFGKADTEEWAIVQSLNHIADYKLHDGWNEIILGLDREDKGFTGGEPKWAHMNWFRLFNNADVDVGESFTWGLDNIHFWDGISNLADGYEYEYYTKTGVNDDFVEKTTAATQPTFYFTDENRELVLKFPVKNAATANNAFILTKCGSQLLLQVSTDGTNWVDLFKDESGVATGISVGSRYFNITDKIDIKSAKNIYVRYADSVPTNGNGGRCYDIGLYLSYLKPEIVDPHHTVISSLDSTAGVGGFSQLNTTIKNEGKASISKTFNGTAGANGGILFQLTFSGLKTKSFDTRNYEAVVFDMYVSDDSVIKNIRFEMEFTSGGGCDNEESRINDTFANYVATGTTFQTGWNTIVIPFAKLSGNGLKREKLNFIRFYNLDAANFTSATTIAFDNIRLWDGQGTVQFGKYVSTKVQGFSVYTNGTKDAKYDALNPTNTETNVHTEAFTPQELQYLVFTNAPSNGNDGNRGRYHDGATYSIWKFDTKGAETAKFITTCFNSILLSVSKDMQEWTTVFSSGDERSKQETRTFDLTDYIDGDVMYVKAADSKPDDGWGFYMMPTGTYFVTTTLKDLVADNSDVDISFTQWAADGEYVKYTLSDWWAGKTGSGNDLHPFYDRGIGDTKNFGGPQVVFAFPTNPNNKYAAVNLQVNSNAKIEISKDFVNWDVYTEKTNYDNAGRPAAMLDISDYVGGSDMIYIRVRSSEDLTGNGPQIHTDFPIRFVSKYEAPADEILWDDCSDGSNVVSLFSYNAELNGIGFTKKSGEDTMVATYGKAGQNPIDVRFMKWFEFDVYVSNPFPKGYNNQYYLELLDAPDGSDKREIQYTDFVLYEGWNHVVLPLPGNYLRNKTTVTGDIDLSAITSFRFFSTTEEKNAEYTLVIKNLKFSNSLYVPTADWNNVTPNDTATWAKDAKGFTMNIGDANAVELDVFSKQPDKLIEMFFEITSAGKYDEQEQQIVLKDYILKAGWNHIIVPLKDNTVNANSFDRTKVNYIRVFGKIGSGNIWSVRNVKFTQNDLLNSLISSFAKKGDRPVVAKTDFRMDLTDAKYVAFDLYLQDPELFMTSNAYLALELSSSGACDNQEYQFTFGSAIGHTYPNSIDVSGLKAGWNRIVLPLNDALVTKGPVQPSINYLRTHYHCEGKDVTAGPGWMAVDNFEAIKDLKGVTVSELSASAQGFVGVCDGAIVLSQTEAGPSVVFDYADGATAAAAFNPIHAENAETYDKFETYFEVKTIKLDDQNGKFAFAEKVNVNLGAVDTTGSQKVVLYVDNEGALVPVEFVNDADGFRFEAEGTKSYVLCVVYVESKAGATPYSGFQADMTAFDPGTSVFVDSIEQAKADPALLENIGDSLADFEEEYEEALPPQEKSKSTRTYSTVAIYDIYALKDMAEVQPSGTVKMSITAPTLTTFETAKLIHIHDDGSKEEVAYTVNGDKWEFELDSFSNLVIIKVTAQPLVNPYTGDNVVIYVGLALASMIALASCAVIFSRKKRDNA